MFPSSARPVSARLLALVLLLAGDAFAAVVNYDLVYVRQPRFGNNTNTIWPEVFHPALIFNLNLILLERTAVPPDTVTIN